jgi:(p)ppGpp synthase/HD superfamily hydrolase
MDTEADFGAASHLGYKAKTVGIDGLSGNTDDWVSKFFNIFK